ncbi:MAG: glycosyltransferase, partial [Methanosphaera sp.]|nr:glycosyltransferase [Methanosphaera sp.]
MFKKISKIFHKEPIVSVIIPAYNVESYIHQCIDSVLNQTLQNIEVIIVDDHSTDNTYSILGEYANQDKRIKLLRNDVNKGQSYSRNKALNMAKGKYVYFVDSDDWIELDALESLVTIADQNELDLLFLKLVTYNEETGEYEKTDYYSYTIIKEFENKIFNYQNINPKLLYSIAVSPPSKLYKRSLIEENNIRFIEGVIYEDNVFCNEIFLKADRVSLVDKYLYNRRIRPDSTMQDTGIKNREIIDVSKALLNVLLKDNNLYYKYNPYLYNFMLNAIRKYHNIIDDKYMMEYFDYYKEFIKRCILEYGVNQDIQKALTSNNLYFYNLGVLSINSDNQEILTLQADTSLDVKVSIIIDCMNHTFNQLSDIIRSIVLQSISFPLLEFILLYEDNYDKID